MLMKDRLFSEYIAKSHMGSNLTDSELKALKEDNIDDIVATFIKVDNSLYMMQLQSVLKNLKFVLGDRIILKSISKKKIVSNEYLACQVMDGDIDALTGITGDKEVLLKIASIYADEDFLELNEDAYDSLCEFINVISGSFATKLCDNNIEMILHPPIMYCNSSIESSKEFYVVTLDLEGDAFDVVMASDNTLKVNKAAG